MTTVRRGGVGPLQGFDFGRGRAPARVLALALALAAGGVAGCRCEKGTDAGMDGASSDAAADSGGSDAATATDAESDAGGATFAATPIGLLATDSTLYVAAAALDSVTFAPGPGFVAAFDRATNAETGRAASTQPQPQFMALDPSGTSLLVANSGVVDFSMFPAIFVASPGGLDVLSAADVTAPGANLALTLPAGPSPTGGALGAIAPAALGSGSLLVYGGSALTGDLYAFDVTAGTVPHDTDAPISYFAPSSGFTGVHDVNGVLLVTDFSSDTVCFGGDAAADLGGPTCASLRVDPLTPAGLNGACGFGAPGGDIYVIANLSSELLVVDPLDPANPARLSLGTFVDPQGLACGADGFVYVTLSFGQDRVVRYDPAGGTLDGGWLMLAAGTTPRDVVVVGPPPATGYVAGSGNDTIVVFDAVSAAVTATIDVAAP
ncbi:MAG TPA: hypothetical protein VG389_13900 [Myxococcota bacterium]|jgi:DNA-binding beta-propeller fold protein YncE|nr:hypothetical protein [Myxococcota bacterium]